jgi:nicotinamidase-related amidase
MDFISRDHAVLAVIDVQERLVAAMPEDGRAVMLRNVLLAIDAAKILGLPIIVSEQYPKGLGPTVTEIRERLGHAFSPVEKIVFSCGRSAEFRAALDATNRRQVLLCGVESHVCVFQTALDLVNDGYKVHVPADAVMSRRVLDWKRAIALMEDAGAMVGTTEMFLFQLLERAGTDEFKAISKLVK